MSPQRRRMAGDAARRRRRPAEPTKDTDPATTEAPEEPGIEGTASTAPDDTAATDTTEVAEPEPIASESAADETADVPGRRRSLFAMPPRETWWWLAILAVITVCALVFVAVVGLGYLSERGDDAALAQGREEATSAAATAAEEILSYDYQSLDSDRAAAQKLMTDDFKAEYDKLYSGEYCDLIPEQKCTETGTFTEVVKQRKQSVSASVAEVAPLECGDECSASETKVLLFIDQSTTANGKELPPTGTHAVFTMVERDGAWLVDDIV